MRSVAERFHERLLSAARVFGYDVFISYGTVDAKAYALRLANRLETQKRFIDRRFVFIDRREIEPGTLLDSTLRRGVVRSRCLLVIETAGARRSKFVAQEIALAFERGIPVARIIPVASDPDRRTKGQQAWTDLREPELSRLNAIVGADEPEEAIAAGEPSPETIASLLSGLVKARARRWVITTAVASAIAAALAAWLGAGSYWSVRLRNGLEADQVSIPHVIRFAAAAKACSRGDAEISRAEHLILKRRFVEASQFRITDLSLSASDEVVYVERLTDAVRATSLDFSVFPPAAVRKTWASETPAFTLPAKALVAAFDRTGPVPRLELWSPTGASSCAGMPAVPTEVAADDQGTQLAALTGDSVYIWQTNKCLRSEPGSLGQLEQPQRLSVPSPTEAEGCQGIARHLAFSPSGRTLALSTGARLHLYDLRGDRSAVTLSLPSAICRIEFVANDSIAFATTRSVGLQPLEPWPASGPIEATVETQPGVHTLVTAPDGRIVVSLGGNSREEGLIWRDGNPSPLPLFDHERPEAAAFSADSDYLFILTRDISRIVPFALTPDLHRCGFVAPLDARCDIDSRPLDCSPSASAAPPANRPLPAFMVSNHRWLVVRRPKQVEVFEKRLDTQTHLAGEQRMPNVISKVPLLDCMVRSWTAARAAF